MNYVNYSQRDLFNLALRNIDNIDLLKVLVENFRLDVNQHNNLFYDTLLYQAVKNNNEQVAKYLIEKGACVNAKLGGYPNSKTENKHNQTILEVVGENSNMADLLIENGAISFADLNTPKANQIYQKFYEMHQDLCDLSNFTYMSNEEKNAFIKDTVDYTHEASADKNEKITLEELNEIDAPQNVIEDIKKFINSHCEKVNEQTNNKQQNIEEREI